MDAVDSYIPTPERAVDKPFLMPVEDVFTITGRGTVGTGRVERGQVKVGEEVEIVGLQRRSRASRSSPASRCSASCSTSGIAGDNIGVLLRGIERNEIERGQVLAKPGSIKPHKKFKAEVYVLSKEEGGRHTPFFANYRPQFYFRTTDVTGTIKLPEGVEMVMPGDNVQMDVELITPIACEEGLRFAIREGGRTVGAGVVTSVIGLSASWRSRRSASGSRPTITRSSINRPSGSSTRRSAPARSSAARCRFPTEINRFCVLRSPHVDKKSREHFEMRTHKRLIDILQASPKTMDALMHLDLPAGVDIELKA